MRMVVDLERWQAYLHIFIEGQVREEPALRERLHPDFCYDHTRDLLLNMLWNELHKGTKYAWDRWDIDGEIEKWFERYFPYSGEYSKRGRKVDQTDYQSVRILDCMDRLQRKIHLFVQDNELMSAWKIYEIFKHGRESYILEVYGDYRAQQWCESNGVPYEPREK